MANNFRYYSPTEEIDFLLALEGGSVIDTAKAAAYGLAEPEHDVWELFQHTRTAKFTGLYL